MQRAATAAHSVSYSGRQSFLRTGTAAPSLRRSTSMTHAGQGSQVMVNSQNGQQLLKGFTPAIISSRVVDDELLGLLERNYHLSATRGTSVAGRSATLVTATRDGSPFVAARWWIDDATGIVLWQETYDKSGSVDLSFGFTSVSVSRADSILEHLPPRLAVPRTNTSLTLSSAAELNASGWSSPRKLAGLSLVRLRSDRAGNPDTVQLVYSDGLTTVSVFEQRGRLTTVPPKVRNGMRPWEPTSVVAPRVSRRGSPVTSCLHRRHRRQCRCARATPSTSLPHDGADDADYAWPHQSWMGEDSVRCEGLVRGG